MPAAKGSRLASLLALLLAVVIATPAAASIPRDTFSEPDPRALLAAVEAAPEPASPPRESRFRLYDELVEPRHRLSLAELPEPRLRLLPPTKTRVRAIELPEPVFIEVEPPPTPTRFELYGHLRPGIASEGTFLQQDPLGYVDGPNLYTYAGNDPVNFTDPLGLCKGEPGDPEECVDWWPYWPPGVVAETQEDLDSAARNPELGRVERALYGAQAWWLGVGASAEEESRHLLNLPHHIYSRWRRDKARQERTRELQAELGCTFCVGEDLGIIHETLVAEGLLDEEVMGPGVANLPIGPGRFKPRVPRGTARFVVSPSGQTRIFLRGGTLEVSEHAAQRITQRGLTLDAVEGVVTQQQPFRYFHAGVWKTGYYDPASRVFVGTVDDTLTTVINNATPKYIQNLQALQP